MLASAEEQQQPQQPAPQKAPGAKPQPQEMYNLVITAAMEILYDEKLNKQIMEMLQKAAAQPAVALARVVEVITNQLQQAATIPEDVMRQATGEILSLVAELATQAGLFEVNKEDLAQAAQELQYKPKPKQQQPAPQQQQPPAQPQQPATGLAAGAV